MATLSASLMREHVEHWSRIVLATVALLFFAGITSKIVVSGSLPFGSSQHWAVHESLGDALQALAYSVWVLAVLGRMGRRFIIGAIVLAISFSLEGQSLTLFTALALISLSLWMGLRALDQIRHAPTPASRLHSTAKMHMS